MEGDVTLPVQSINEFGRFINEYGFLIIFGAVILIALGTGIFMFLRSWNKRESARIASESDKAKIELDLLTKERLANIEQNKQMYELVTKVQSEQVVQMENISKVIVTLKDEVVNSASIVRQTLENTETLETDVCGILKKVDRISKELEELAQKIDQIRDLLRSTETVTK